jgi:hypothetical protein
MPMLMMSCSSFSYSNTRGVTPGRAIHWRDRRRIRVAEATSQAGVLEGQPAEASGQPAEPCARARFLEETPAAMARAWC